MTLTNTLKNLIAMEDQIIAVEQKANESLNTKGLSPHAWEDAEIETLCELYAEYKDIADTMKKKSEEFKELIFALREPGTVIGPYELQLSQYTQTTLPRKDMMLELGKAKYEKQFAQFEKHTQITRKQIKVQK